MTNNELTIEELQGIAGCGTSTGNAFRLDKSSTKFADRNQSKAIIHPDFIVDPIHKVGLRGIGDAVERAVAVPAFL